MPPRVSIVLPTFNGEAELRRLMPVLRAQEDCGELEIRAIDSSSADGSVALLEQYGATVERIDQGEFGHGRTRNRCARSATGEILVFLSQDALPRDERFLADLLSAFDDPKIAGATARVLPQPGDDPLAARTVLDLPESSDRPTVRHIEHVEGIWKLDPLERGRYLRFNNVASAIRADVFRDIPFPEVGFGEDFAWAARCLSAGWRIAFVPEAVVYHAHNYTLGAAFARYRQDALFHRLAHGLKVRPTVRSAVRGFLYEVWRDVRYLRREGGARAAGSLLRSPGLRGAQVLGQYVGSHAWGASQPQNGAGSLALHL